MCVDQFQLIDSYLFRMTHKVHTQIMRSAHLLAACLSELAAKILVLLTCPMPIVLPGNWPSGVILITSLFDVVSKYIPVSDHL